MSQTKQVTQTIQSILNTLPSTSKPPLNYEKTIINKCLEKIRILNSKLGYEGCLGKNDHRQSRVAICLEYVIRRDIPNYSGPTISINHLAQSVGMKMKLFMELKGKMDHYFENNLVIMKSTKSSSSSTSSLKRREEINDHDIIQKLLIKIGSQGMCDSHEKVAHNARRLLLNIQTFINQTKINNIRNAAMNDFTRKKEIYAAACFTIECIKSQTNVFDDGKKNQKNTKKRNVFSNQLINAVVTAAKLTPHEFDHVLKHVDELLKKCEKKNVGSNDVDESMAQTLQLHEQVKRKKRKHNDNFQLNIDDTVQSKHAKVDKNDDKDEPIHDILKDIINNNNNIDHSIHKSKTPDILQQIEQLKQPIEKLHPQMSKSFYEWKNRILDDAKKNVREVISTKNTIDNESQYVKNFVFEGKNCQYISDREALNIAANNCLEKLSVYHEK